MMRLHTQGQISVFLILAVILLLSGISIYLASPHAVSAKGAETVTTTYNFNEETDLLNEYLTRCLEFETQEAITDIGVYDTGCHLISADTLQTQSKISLYINSHIEGCIDDGYFTDRGMSIDKGTSEANTLVNGDTVLIELHYPLLLKHLNQTASLNDFYYMYTCSQNTLLPPIPPVPPTPPTPPVLPDLPDQKVFLLIFNPVIASSGGKKLTEVQNWGDPYTLTSQYISDIKDASRGLVNYVLVDYKEVDGFPTKLSGYVFDYPSYYQCMLTRPACTPTEPCCEGVDYRKLLVDNQICDKVNSGEIDELWVFGGPRLGFYEANMAGTGAWWTNGDIIDGTTCNKPLHIMGFNYERTVGEMLEDFGHRVEGTLIRAPRPQVAAVISAADWDKFDGQLTRYDLNQDCAAQTPVAINGAHCGNVHFAPNSKCDYDWSNLTPAVISDCDDWYNYPTLKGETKVINCAEWGCDITGHHIWWLKHLPKDWWKLLFYT